MILHPRRKLYHPRLNMRKGMFIRGNKGKISLRVGFDTIRIGIRDHDMSSSMGIKQSLFVLTVVWLGSRIENYSIAIQVFILVELLI